MPDMPNTTSAQRFAWAATIATSLVVLFKLDLTDAQQAALVTILIGLGSVAHFVADAIVRHGRATGVGAELAKAAPAVDRPPADGDDSQLTLGGGE